MQMDFSSVPDPEERTNIPSGTKARVIISSAEEKFNDSGVVTFNMVLNIVDEGSYKGRTIWTRDTLHHPESNQKEGCFQSEQIGKGHLKQLIQALRLNPLELDSSNPWQLLNKIVLVTIGISKSKNPDFPPQNQINKYESASGVSAQQAGAPVPFAPARPLAPPAAPVPQAPPMAPAPYQTPQYAPLPSVPQQFQQMQVPPTPSYPPQVPWQPQPPPVLDSDAFPY